jgi:hypothetical protein
MDDREAIAHAYNAVRRTGGLDYPAFQAAVAAYRRRHPDISERAAELTVARLITDAATYIPEIIWDGVGSGPVKPYKRGAYIWE